MRSARVLSIIAACAIVAFGQEAPPARKPDVVYVPMYLYKQLVPTAALYTVFLVLAVIGLVRWRRSLRANAA